MYPFYGRVGLIPDLCFQQGGDDMRIAEKIIIGVVFSAWIAAACIVVRLVLAKGGI